MNHGTLALFPEHSLDQSILVAVLLGIYVLLFFCEMFGWVWAGLVVPGYLASVFAVAPDSGITICLEAILTFVVSRGVSDVMARLAGWSAFFGRERFFLIVLVSVVVRQGSELWVVRDLLAWVDTHADTSLGANHAFASIGLVLVPLLANMFWKLTLPRGIFQVGVSVAITWAILAFVLLPYTNLSYSSFESTYEDVALDFLGSPKAYIILLTTSFIAAYGNLMYGWDYNGILVPSLLALSWFEPRALWLSIVEALLLLFATKLVVQLPGIRKLNLEGPRKLTTVYTVGFALKYATGWLFAWLAPEARLTSYYGFGYVLTSLIAVKMMTTKKIGRVLLPSIAVSFVGFVVGSGIGLALHLVWPRPAEPTLVEATVVQAGSLWETDEGATLGLAARTRFEAGATTPAYRRARKQFWQLLSRRLATGEPAAAPSHQLHALARELGLELSNRPERLIIREAGEQLSTHRGQAGAIVWPRRRGPLVVVRHPRTAPLSVDASLWACAMLECQALVMAGVDASHDDPSLADAMTAFRQASIVELALVDEAKATVRVFRTPTGHVPLRRLDGLADGHALPLDWQPEHPYLVSREARRLALDHEAGYVIVDVPAPKLPEVLARFIADAPGAMGGSPSPPGPGPDDHAWLASQLLRDAHARPRAMSETERLLLERELLPRLWRAELPSAWRIRLAQTMGLEATRLRGPDGSIGYAGTGDRAWLTMVFNDQAQPHALTQRLAAPVAPPPRPSQLAITASAAYQEPGVASLALLAWREAGAKALILATTAPAAAKRSQAPAFAAHMGLAGLMREPDIIIDMRGFGANRGATVDVLLATGKPVFDPRDVPEPLRALWAPAGPLGRLVATFRWLAGDLDADLNNASAPVYLYAAAFGGPHVATAWLSPEVRQRGTIITSRDEAQRLAQRLGIPWHDDPIAPHAPIASQITPRTRALALRYAGTDDEVALRALQRLMPRALTLGLEPWSQRVLLRLDHATGATLIVVGPGLRKTCKLTAALASPSATVDDATPLDIDRLERGVALGCREISLDAPTAREQP